MKNQVKKKNIRRQVRHRRVRAVVNGTAERPRLSVFRSGRHIYAQLIDDLSSRTLAAASSLEVKAGGKKTDVAAEVGKLLARKAAEKSLSSVVFDRGGFAYHGRVRALAEGARQGGLKF